MLRPVPLLSRRSACFYIDPNTVLQTIDNHTILTRASQSVLNKITHNVPLSTMDTCWHTDKPYFIVDVIFQTNFNFEHVFHYRSGFQTSNTGEIHNMPLKFLARKATLTKRTGTIALKIVFLSS